MQKPLRVPQLRPSISSVLTLGVGLLMLLAGIAFGFAMLSGRLNTVDLLRDRNDRIVSQLVERTELQLDPVQQHVEALRDRLESGRLGTNDIGRLTDYIVATLDGLPQVDALGLLRPNLAATRAERRDGHIVVRHGILSDLPNAGALLDEQKRQALANAMKPSSHWGQMLWSSELQQPLINLSTPVVRDGTFIGGLGAVVSLGTLSRLLEQGSVDGQSVSFILYDNRFVLAHPTLINHQYHLSAEQPMPTLDEIDDPILSRIWTGRTDVRMARAMLSVGGAHIVEAEGKRWIFVYRELHQYGNKPWLVGRYFPFDQIDTEVERLQWAAVVGGVSLVLSLLIAWRLGYLIRRPLLDISAAANRLRNLDFDTPPLGRTRLRELDDASQAINSANAALRWFGNYVPRKLVNRLVREGEDAVNVSKHRDVTVVFTDLVGFTAMSERLTAQETADLLNEHFALVTACIEAEGGIVDKFIGDAVMAMWGAIKRDEDHAVHACAAVRAIGMAMAADNARRLMLGKPILRMRVGIHSGPVVIGNIGAPGRINFTVVGDTVNTAQRLEQLGHDHMNDIDQFIALASAETVEAARLDPPPPPVGLLHVKGRVAPIEVYRLVRRP
ncbi:adenylate/guanylate cyclase domain-containing protein [Ferrovibrio xuzhouensis]|uniref:Adenylate/guanylate cyclase domain-containing protein n=1 Tax=Ferrovibrio xuzhouensis TaxID=1576914 RepID=A0ABV7V9M6_9PROT